MLYIWQKEQLWTHLTPYDNFCFFGAIYDLSGREAEWRIAELSEIFELSDFINTPVRNLSLGQRIRCEIVASLIHKPKVLFLDEPTIGLDAIAAKQIRSFLKEINEEKGTTILLTSHYIEDIKTLCRRTVVINHGTKIYDGATDELFDRYQRNKKIIVTYDSPTDYTVQQTKQVDVVMDEPYKKIYETPKENARHLFSELMAHEPKDIVVEEEEIGIVVERIYQETGIDENGGIA